MIVNKMEPTAEAQAILIERRYRKEYGLSAVQMLEEPSGAVLLDAVIHELEYDRSKLEEHRSKQRGQK